VLVAHGDYYGGVRQLNPLEPGIYMPLSMKDLEMFKPRIVFLGHIHKPLTIENVHYAGSPCGMDISETGKRKFLIYDTSTGIVEDRFVVTDVLYFNESFVIVPQEDEVPRIKQEIESRIQGWDIDPSDHQIVRVRVNAKGYAADRAAISTAIEEGFGKFRFYKDEGPRLENLSVSSDRQLNAIAERAMELIDESEWNFGGIEPTKDQIVEATLSSIYGD
jgi:DNA repair exonuclease SbcCD nuclease subunit